MKDTRDDSDHYTQSNDGGSADKEMREMSAEFDDLVSQTDNDGIDKQTEQNDSIAQSQHLKNTKSSEVSENTSQSDNQQPFSSGSKLKKYFLYTLVGGLILAALISSIAVLAGEFNSTMSKALATTGLTVLHTLIALVFITISDNRRSKTTELALNALLLITVGSFITSILATWEIITGRIVGELYLLYLYPTVAIVWSRLLLKVGENVLDKPTRIASLAAVVFTILFYLFLLPTIFIHYPDKVPEIVFRALAASAILLATTSVLTTVFHRIYIFKHPETKTLSSSKPSWDFLIALIAIVLGVPIIFTFVSMIAMYNTASKYDLDDHSTPSPSQLPEKSGSPNGQSSHVEPKDYDDCTAQRAYRNMQLVTDDTIETFKSHDPAQKQVTTEVPSLDYEEVVYSYAGTLTTLDKDCNPINPATLRNGDGVVTYANSNTTNEVYLLQRVEEAAY